MESDAHDAPDTPLAPASPRCLMGQVVGGYRLVETLGRWAIGAVYLGERVAPDGSLPQKAVVKLLGSTWTCNTVDHADHADLQTRFKRELAIVQRLDHPHILRLLAFGGAWGFPYMVFPFVSGGTLMTALRGGPLPLPETARYLSEIAAALDYAHGQGIPHGDVKPSNVLLDAEGASYLSEFGLARLLPAAGDTGPPPGVVIGTPEYMAPEQAQGAVVGPAADIYGLGVLLYQLVTGALPFSGQSPVEVLMRVLRDAPTSPRALRPELPAQAEAVVLRGLAKRPEDRFGGARQLAHAFALGLDGQLDGR